MDLAVLYYWNDKFMSWILGLRVTVVFSISDQIFSFWNFRFRFLADLSLDSDLPLMKLIFNFGFWIQLLSVT